ncbi:MAG TPA: YbaK/EbsC family protein [Usitatibacter sp.]|nr:YbaK/EbsC family protein [Usitatibacter sp.]
MGVAARIERYLAEHELSWQRVGHSPSGCAMDSAHRAHVLPAEMAKAIVLEDDYGYVVAVIPADRRLDLDKVRQALDRDLALANEGEVAELFPDCEPGAVPPMGEAYGIATVWDASLGERPEVYFEAGDHRTLVRVSGRAFAGLMTGADRIDATRD